LGGLVLYLAILAGALIAPAHFLFPVGITYVAYGIIRAIVLSLGERNDDRSNDDNPPMSLVQNAARSRRIDRTREQGE
jgi:hypothetical protein